MEQFKIKAKKQIETTIIKSVWTRLSNELWSEYPAVRGLVMPSIRGYILDPKPFDRLQRKLINSKFLLNTGQMEYGSTSPIIASASVFKDKDGWVILKCKDRYSIERDLRHEILHIFEHILGLSTGTLSRYEMKIQEEGGIDGNYQAR